MYQVIEIDGKIFMTDLYGRPDMGHAFRDMDTAQRASEAARRVHNDATLTGGSMRGQLCQTGGDL